MKAIYQCPKCKKEKEISSISVSTPIFRFQRCGCGKILRFNKGARFSMHYHIEKDETWYVNKGEFLLKKINTKTAEVEEIHLSKGSIVRNLPGEPHQLISETTGAEIFEVSTRHLDQDSYRVWKGDSQE